MAVLRMSEKIIQSKLSTLDESLTNNKIEVGKAEAKIAVLKERLAQQPQRIKSNIDKQPNPRIVELKEQLVALEIDMDRLLKINSPDDKFVRYKQREVEKLREQIAQLPEEIELKHVSIV